MNEGQDTRPNPPWPRIIAGLAVLAVFLATVLVLWRIGILDRLRDGAALEQAVMQFGPLGPFLIIGLMTVAIVMSPIPSAPIALASAAISARIHWVSASKRFALQSASRSFACSSTLIEM